MRVTVVATGIESEAAIQAPPRGRAQFSSNVTPMRGGYVDPRGEVAAVAGMTASHASAPMAGAASTSAGAASAGAGGGQGFAARPQMVSTSSALAVDPAFESEQEEDLAEAFQAALDPENDPELELRLAKAGRADAAGAAAQVPAQRSLLPEDELRRPAGTGEGQGARMTASLPPRGEDAPFIAPEPMRPPRRVEGRNGGEAGQAAPIREAAIVHAATQDGGKGRRPSIFRRMTGVGLGRGGEDLETAAGQGAAQSAVLGNDGMPPAAERREADRKEADRREAMPSRQQARPAATAPRAAASQAAGKSPTLGGLDPSDRLPRTADEDDLLEIPAFLRRQAN